MKIEAKDFINYLENNLSDLRSTCSPLWHPLGFVSCIIKEEKDYVIRVHYWPNGERRVKNPDWPIHTHSYNLSSYVINGGVQDLQYKKNVTGEHIIYSVRYFEGGSEIIQTENTMGIDVLVDEVRCAGEQYNVALDTFHQSVVPFDRSAVTIVALSSFSDDAPLVLGAPGQDSYPYDRTSFDKEEFWIEVTNGLKLSNNL